MLSTDKEKSSLTNISSGSSSGGEWDRPDGAHASKPAAPATPATAVTAGNALNNNTLDYVERNSILNDPRAGRVKAPRRRPPSQALRDDTPLQIGLSNGHEVPTEKPTERLDKAEEIKPRTRSWEKHRAPWMEELKLNQAKKGFEVRPRTGDALPGKASSGSTDRILECGLEEKRSSHSMEMSKSTSSISSRMSVLESYEETKVRQSSDSKKEVTPAHREDPPSAKPTLHSPTAAGRTLMNMLDEIKKPNAPPPPLAPARPPPEPEKAARTDKLTDVKPTESVVKAARTDKPTDAKPTDSVVKAARTDKPTDAKPTDSVVKAARTEKIADKPTDNVVLRAKDKAAEPVKPAENIVSRASGFFEKTSTLERIEKVEEKIEKPQINNEKGAHGTVDRLLHSFKLDKTEMIEKNEKSEKSEGTEALIAQLNNRISNLEKIIEVQNSMFNAAIADLTSKLKIESEKRQQLQSEMEKLAHCVTQV